MACRILRGIGHMLEVHSRRYQPPNLIVDIFESQGVLVGGHGHGGRGMRYRHDEKTVRDARLA
jgi:hypothetical protein